MEGVSSDSLSIFFPGKGLFLRCTHCFNDSEFFMQRPEKIGFLRFSQVFFFILLLLTHLTFQVAIQLPDVIMRILLVEDEPGIANFIKQGLEEEAYTVDIMDEGVEGLQRAL